MRLSLINKRAQSIAEYAILIGIVIAAAVAMQTYVKRGLQGGIKYAVDYAAKPKEGFPANGQYEPYYLQSQYTTTHGAAYNTEELKSGGRTERISAADLAGTTGVQSTRTGFQKTANTTNAD